MTPAELRMQIANLKEAKAGIDRSIAQLEKILKGMVATCTISEASRLYGFNVQTLHAWKNKGKITYVKDPVKGYLLNMNELESIKSSIR